MSGYQIVNGIPRHLPHVLEKVDTAVVSADPHHRLMGMGFTQKESLLLQLSSFWDEVKTKVNAGVKKNDILVLCDQHGFKF